MTLAKALVDTRFIIIFFLLILVDMYSIYLITNFKVIYMPIVNDDHFLGYCLVINTMMNILGTFFWGWLADLKGFTFSVFIAVAFNLIACTIGFFTQTNVGIFMLVFVLGIADRGMETISGPGFIEIFNLKIAT